MAQKLIDWSLHGDELRELYMSGLSTREVVDVIEAKHGVKYASGSLRRFLGKTGMLRTQAEGHELVKQKKIHLCEHCNKPHVPRNYNQRWCDACTGDGKYTRRISAHGLPAIVIEKQFKQQEQRCAICGKHYDNMINDGGKGKRALFIDHDHETMQFRGLLCVKCNTGMGFIDNVKWLAAALRYKENASNEAAPVFTRPKRKRHYVRNKPVLAQHDA